MNVFLPRRFGHGTSLLVPQLSSVVSAYFPPSRYHPRLVTAIRDAHAIPLERRELIEISRETLSGAQVLGESGPHYLVSKGQQLLLVNRGDVEDAREAIDLAREMDELEMPLEDDDITMTPPNAPPVQHLRNKHAATRTLQEWIEDPDASKLAAVVLPKIANAGEMTMISGRWREGKTTFVTWLCTEASHGRDILGGRVEPTTCHWISFEEAPALVVNRFKQSGADPSRVLYTDGFTIPAPSAVEEVKRLIRKTSAKVVVVDSLARLYLRGGAIQNENDNASWVRALDDMQQVVRESGVALIFLHHLSKAGDPRGSTAVPAAMDSAISMRTPKGSSRRRILEIRGRSIMDEVAVEKDQDTLCFVEVLDSTENTSALERRVCELLRKHAKVSAARVVEELQIAKQRGLRLIRDLISREVIVREGAGATTYLVPGPRFREVLPD